MNDFLLILVASLLLFSCNRNQHPSVLVDADNLCYSNPEKVLNDSLRLKASIDTTNMHDMMYYQIIMLKAQDKSSCIHPNTTKIAAIVNFYESNYDPKLLPQAYYYAGRTYYELHDSPRALSYYHKVLDELRKRDDVRLRGITNAQIGYIMYDQGNFDKAYTSFHHSFICDSLRKDTTGMAYDLRDMGHSIIDNHKENAIKMFKKALSLSIQSHDSAMISRLNLNLVLFYTFDESLNIDSARKYYHFYPHYLNQEDMSGYHTIAAEYYRRIGKRDSMLHFQNLVLKGGNLYDQQQIYKVRLLDRLSKLKDSGASFLLKKYVECGDTISERTDLKTVSRIQSYYDYGLREKENSQLRALNKQKKYELIILFMALVGIAVSSYSIYIRQKYKTVQLKQQMERLKEIIEESKIHIASLPAMIEKFHESKICTDLNSNLAHGKPASEENWCDLDKWMEENLPTFKTKLTSLTKISNIEYKICTLIKLGYTPAEIANLVCRAESSITMSRRRLYTKIFKKEGKAEDLDKFIREM